MSLPSSESHEPSLSKITTLLKTKDDTSRFVGLALLKPLLDNSEAIRSDPETVTQLWKCIASKFLDRLLRSGSKIGTQSQDGNESDASNMVDLAVSVIHTFVVLLPEDEKKSERAVGRIPFLIGALPASGSEATTYMILQTLLTLVSHQEGALRFDEVEDISSLFQVAPKHSRALDVIYYVWMSLMPLKLTHQNTMAAFSQKLDASISQLLPSFVGTDAVTLLDFTGNLLRNIDERLLPPNPSWLSPLITHIFNLIKSRPTPDSRTAYTILAASLLQSYPDQASTLLFAPITTKTPDPDEKPLPYLFLNLILIDLRASLPTLLQNLNAPSYPLEARRLAAALDIIPAWEYHVLLPLINDDNDENTTTPLTFPTSPDLLLRLRTQIQDTLSLTTEYLRDRWDASVAGIMGLDPSARAKEAELPSGVSRLTLTWDSLHHSGAGNGDIVVFSAIKALGAWTREDDESPLFGEMIGLMDMLVELYRESCDAHATKTEAEDTTASSRQEKLPSERDEADQGEISTQIAAAQIRGPLDFRPNILLALEALTRNDNGINALLHHDIWTSISRDLMLTVDAISSQSPTTNAKLTASALTLAKQSSHLLLLLSQTLTTVARTPEPWLALVTNFAAFPAPLPTSLAAEMAADATEVHLNILDICVSLLENSALGVRRRYFHTMAALNTVGKWVRGEATGFGRGKSTELVEGVDLVLRRLGHMRGY